MPRFASQKEFYCYYRTGYYDNNNIGMPRYLLVLASAVSLFDRFNLENKLYSTCVSVVAYRLFFIRRYNCFVHIVYPWFSLIGPYFLLISIDALIVCSIIGLDAFISHHNLNDNNIIQYSYCLSWPIIHYVFDYDVHCIIRRYYT